MRKRDFRSKYFCNKAENPQPRQTPRDGGPSGGGCEAAAMDDQQTYMKSCEPFCYKCSTNKQVDKDTLLPCSSCTKLVHEHNCTLDYEFLHKIMWQCHATCQCLECKNCHTNRPRSTSSKVMANQFTTVHSLKPCQLTSKRSTETNTERDGTRNPPN